jgi:GDP-D-mannose 3',5'-epimerase
MKRVLVAGAGGFIGGWLVNELVSRGYQVRAVDIKKSENWYQINALAENLELDLSIVENCIHATKEIDEVYNLAADMGGMGFIENNKALCMLSVLINTNLITAANNSGARKYFYASSACVYAQEKQLDTMNLGLKEEDAYPANPEDGYGWEKLFSERMCRHFFEDFGIEVRIARFHNVYGPFGTYEGGREKAPAAICRKVIESVLNGSSEIEVWGDGEQTRSFTFITDTVKGILLLMESDFRDPINIGSSQMISINGLIDLVGMIENAKIVKNYDLAAPKGVRGRNSDNTLIKSVLNWEPEVALEQGMAETYSWIKSQMLNEGP